MADFSLLLQHGLTYGIILSLAMSLIIFGSIYYNPEMWLGDYPPDIQQKFGPISETADKQRKILFIPFFLSLIGLIIYSVVQLGQRAELTFSAVFISTFFLLFTFNLVDLLIFDWLIGVWIRPKFIILPGTEGLAGYSDYWFHFRGFLIGIIFCLVSSMVVAAVTLGVNWISS